MSPTTKEKSKRRRGRKRTKEIYCFSSSPRSFRTVLPCAVQGEICGSIKLKLCTWWWLDLSHGQVITCPVSPSQALLKVPSPTQSPKPYSKAKSQALLKGKVPTPTRSSTSHHLPLTIPGSWSSPEEKTISSPSNPPQPFSKEELIFSQVFYPPHCLWAQMESDFCPQIE